MDKIGAGQQVQVIAHRGASGYLPEHTLAAKSLAYAMGADFLEQDVVASRDDHLIILHDIHLDRVSNVATVFPLRARSDGRYYVRDFDLEELRRLAVYERFTSVPEEPVYPGRFPAASGHFGINTLGEEIQLVLGLNRSTSGTMGIYPEIKSPAWHHREGVDLATLLLKELRRYGYTGPHDRIFVQCFDAVELRRVREELHCELPLVQLIGEDEWGESDTDYSYLITPHGLAEVAQYANAIGPWTGQMYELTQGEPRVTGLAGNAQQAGLTVHPYTFRVDELAPGFKDFASMVRWFVQHTNIDGLFTDFPDQAMAILRGGP